MFNSILQIYGHQDPDPGNASCWQIEFEFLRNKTWFFGGWNSSLEKTIWTPHEIHEYLYPLMEEIKIINSSFSGNKITFFVDGPSTLPSSLNLTKSSYYQEVGLRASDYEYNVTNLTFIITIPKSWEGINESNLTVYFDGENITSYSKPIIKDLCGGYCDFKYIMLIIPEISSHKVEIVYGYAEDTQPPTYSSNSTNSTQAGSLVLFSLKWDDNVALHPNGQWQGWLDNCTGNFVNVTPLTNFSSTPGWSNFTAVINETEGCTIRWFVNASDNAGNWNNTGAAQPFSFVTTSPVMISITLSLALQQGIMFLNCYVNENCSALNNTSNNGGTGYNITLDPSSTDNVKIAHATSGDLLKDGIGSQKIIIGNVTAIGNVTSASGSNLIVENAVSLQKTNYLDVKGCSGSFILTPGDSCYLRFWLSIPPSQTVGNYNTTYCFCAYLASEDPSICGSCYN